MAAVADPVVTALYRAHADAGPKLRRRGRWVMDRPSYDRLRAAMVTEDQEHERADRHASAFISAEPPYRCPACEGSLFETLEDLTAHIRRMADPGCREPDPGDQVFGRLIVVRDGGGEPHLEES